MTQPQETQPQEFDVHDPASVEQAILNIHRRLHNGLRVISELSEIHKAVARVHDEEKARAFLDHQGPQTEKRHAAELSAMPLREQMDEAKVKLEWAQNHARVLEKEMSGLQSILADLRALYGAERGRG